MKRNESKSENTIKKKHIKWYWSWRLRPKEEGSLLL